ncbi:hypothetical protein IKB17_04960 [bacterium]|nr:hypothetical protein [bacterium]
MSRSRKEYTHSIVAQLEDWQLSYNLSSEKSWRDSYFSELLEISAKVLYSENKKIPVYSIINFYIVVEHNMKNYIDKPKLVSVFNNSRKERRCGLTVHPSFLDNFKFLVTQNIKPYFRLTCINNIPEREIDILSFDMESYINISEYYED